MSGTGAGGEGPSRRQQARTYAGIGLAVVAVVFALLNTRQVRVNFIVTTATAPLIVVIVACLAVGLALGMLAARRRSE